MGKIRSRSLTTLNQRVVTCAACPRLRHYGRDVSEKRKRAFRHEEYWGRPVPSFGDPGARLLIVGLAPGAHGANRTGRLFTGDASGEWLYATLHQFGFASQATSTGRNDGLELRDCYITNAARCAPPANKPSSVELATCQPYLVRELELLTSVNTVMTLGRIAHEQWLKAAGWWTALPRAERPVFGHGVATDLPDGAAVIASYHPSRQNTNTGRLTKRMWHAVFRRARLLVERG